MAVNPDGSSIVGGIDISQDHPLSKTVVAVLKMKRVEKIIDGQVRQLIERKVCTGSFITENIVLTAAHCIAESPEKNFIFYGVDALDMKASFSEVEAVVRHADYELRDYWDSERQADDIALIKIQGKKPDDQEVLPLGDLSQESASFYLLSIGYGSTTGLPSKRGQGTGMLRGVKSTAVDFNPQKNYISIDQANHKGICAGDSGGPGISFDEQGRKVVVGIVVSTYDFNRFSFWERLTGKSKEERDECHYRGSYLNLTWYREWIAKGIQELSAASGSSLSASE